MCWWCYKEDFRKVCIDLQSQPHTITPSFTFCISFLLLHLSSPVTSYKSPHCRIVSYTETNLLQQSTDLTVEVCWRVSGIPRLRTLKWVFLQRLMWTLNSEDMLPDDCVVMGWRPSSLAWSSAGKSTCLHVACVGEPLSCFLWNHWCNQTTYAYPYLFIILSVQKTINLVNLQKRCKGGKTAGCVMFRCFSLVTLILLRTQNTLQKFALWRLASWFL